MALPTTDARIDYWRYFRIRIALLGVRSNSDLLIFQLSSLYSKILPILSLMESRVRKELLSTKDHPRARARYYKVVRRLSLLIYGVLPARYVFIF